MHFCYDTVMHIDIIALVFGVIFIAELPDKSLFASLVLGTKFPWLYVWLGAAAAFLVHVIIAVTAGKLLTLLPHAILQTVITLLFLAGALILLFGKQSLEKNLMSKSQHYRTLRHFGKYLPLLL